MHNFITEFSINANQAALTYDLATAASDVWIEKAGIYVVTAGVAPLVSISIQTNQGTPLVLMTAAEGAVANLLIGCHVSCAMNLFLQPWTLRSGEKVQYTITGASGTGLLKVSFIWRPRMAGRPGLR